LIPKSNPIALSSLLNGLVGMKYDWKNLWENGKMLFTANYHLVKKRDRNYKTGGLANCICYLGQLSKERAEGEKIILEKEVIGSIWNGIEKC
jgi:hypothetical protein